MLSRPWPVLLRHAPGRLFFQAYTKLSWPPLASGIALSGFFLYGEPLTANRPVGVAVCLFGLCLINR